MSSVLPGCALIHHNGTPYTEIAPEQINLASDIHLAHDGWPAARWWTRYRDAQLDALIDQALGEAPTMVIARTRVAQAKSDVALARAGTALQVAALASLDREPTSAHRLLVPFSTD